MSDDTFILPPKMNESTSGACITCRNIAALYGELRCVACERTRVMQQKDITSAIRLYELIFQTPFVRMDERWVRISESEEVCYFVDPTDAGSGVFQSAIPVEETDDTIIINADDPDVSISDDTEILESCKDLIRDLIREKSDDLTSGCGPAGIL